MNDKSMNNLAKQDEKANLVQDESTARASQNELQKEKIGVSDKAEGHKENSADEIKRTDDIIDSKANSQLEKNENSTAKAEDKSTAKPSELPIEDKSTAKPSELPIEDKSTAKPSELPIKGNIFSRKKSLRQLVRAAVIAALYVSLTLVVIYAAYGAFQFRISEALTILPLFFSESILGLTVGCFIANLFGNGGLDLTLGTLATLVSAILTFLIGRTKLKHQYKIILGIIPPIVINALVVPFTFLALSELKELYWFSVLTVGFGQLTVLTILGIPLYYSLLKIKDKIRAFN